MLGKTAYSFMLTAFSNVLNSVHKLCSTGKDLKHYELKIPNELKTSYMCLRYLMYLSTLQHAQLFPHPFTRPNLTLTGPEGFVADTQKEK